jgi:isopenicillin N synthase-like dioxygenase
MTYASAKHVDVSLIPVIDISQLRSGAPEALERIARELLVAAETIGFFYVRNHGVEKQLIREVFETSKRFYALPIEDKNKVRINTNHRGFLRAGEAKMSDGAKPDLKESFVWGLDVGTDDADYLAGRPLIGPNQWPGFPADMRSTFVRYFDECNTLGILLLRAFAVSLDLPSDYFVKQFSKPMTRCTTIYYPPQPASLGEEQFGVAPHTDFGTLTLLYQDMVGGLQVKDRDGNWVTAHPIEDTYVVNVGDLLARWTNNRFASTPHRVVNSSGHERYSIAAFVDPNFGCLIDPAVRPGERALSEPITAGDYLVWRFGKAFAYRSAKS